MKVIQYLVFSGGGVRGAAFGGATKKLEESGMLDGIEGVAGASAGAVAATLIALRYNAGEMEATLNALDFKKFEDGSFGVLGEIVSLATLGYMHPGTELLKFYESIIERKTGNKNITFGELQQSGKARDLRIWGFNLNRNVAEQFSAKTTPDMRIADALRISTSVPFFFAPVKYKDWKYEDGGLGNNYPISSFEDVDPTGERVMGFVLVNQDVVEAYQSGLPIPCRYKTNTREEECIANICGVLDGPQNTMLRDRIVDEKTIMISDAGVNFLDFNITDELKKKLEKNGYQATEQFINRVLDQKIRPVALPETKGPQSDAPQEIAALLENYPLPDAKPKPKTWAETVSGYMPSKCAVM